VLALQGLGGGDGGALLLPQLQPLGLGACSAPVSPPAEALSPLGAAGLDALGSAALGCFGLGL
jgi:hypothetical protein